MLWIWRVYQLAKAALPLKDMTREKRASMTLGLQDEAAIYMAICHMKLDRFSRNWHCFSAVTFGREASNYVDYRSPYAAMQAFS